MHKFLVIGSALKSFGGTHKCVSEQVEALRMTLANTSDRSKSIRRASVEVTISKSTEHRGFSSFLFCAASTTE